VTEPILEVAAQKIADATSKPPFLYELDVEGARKVLDDIRAAPIDKLDVVEKWIAVPAAVGEVEVRIVKPAATPGVLPVVLYTHGGGRVLGNAGTHDRLVRELAVGANAAVGDQDRNIPVVVARFMAERAGSKGTREVAGASHAISVGAPDQVTGAIMDAVATAR
jgi:pimeloyl-ACP methyl ester carboxylesterase